MVIKRGSNGKGHYILPVCNMTVFAISFTPETPILGRSVESRTPLEVFFNLCFLTVYMHLFKI